MLSEMNRKPCKLVAVAIAVIVAFTCGFVESEELFTKPDVLWGADGNKGLSDSCFCQLEGQIDDCSCKVNTVDDFNNKKIYPRLKSLLRNDYFRYFQYNPHKSCPFWDRGGKCTSRFCQVETCTSTDLPPGLSKQFAEEGHTRVVENKYSESAQAEGCNRKTKPTDPMGGDGDDLNHSVDDRLSDEAQQELQQWREHDERQSDFCDLEDDDCKGCTHVDLTLNPERFTGYSGDDSHRIWSSIYEENCFRPTGATTPAPLSSAAFRPDRLNSLCLEKRAFYRAVSGLHTSITIHLAANYPKRRPAAAGTAFLLAGVGKDPIEDMNEWGPNLDLFYERFNPDKTDNQGPYWLKNLYFVYLLELRALDKAADYLSKQPYFTGRPDEDAETVKAVRDLLALVNSFPDHFDETSMFTGGREAQALKVEFREHFKNITRLMDCVTCDKCKLWGKLQIKGLGTALKILFADDPSPVQQGDSQQVQASAYNLQLSRNEIVALFNAFGKISTSIVELERFRELLRHR